MPYRFHHDYETYCDLDIKVVGAEAYVRHPSFKILMCSYAYEDDPVKLWVPEEGEPIPAELLEALNHPDVLLYGFHVAFERAVTRHGLGIDLPATRFRCTMAKAYALSFSGGLADVGKQIGLPQDKQKLDTGKKLIQRFCKPAPSNHKAHHYDRHSHPAEWEEFKLYGIQDTETERYIDRWLDQYEPMSEYEWSVWAVDQDINQRGLPVDLDTAHRALELHRIAKKRIIDKMKGITGLANPNSVQQLTQWLRDSYGVVMPNMQAATIDATIKAAFVPQGAIDILKMKRTVGMTAPTKWKAFIQKACPDWLLRGMFVYAAASRTGRWASRGINLQNLKSPSFEDMEAAIWFIRNASIEEIEAFYGDAIRFIAETVRGGITAPDGTVFAVADLSSIESRVVGWIADCKAINDTFAKGLDTYKVMACDIYQKRYEDITKKERKFSKPVVLAGPYGQGAKGLVAYAEDFGVELTKKEAERHVSTFRRKCYEIPRMWKWLEAAIQDAIINSTTHQGYKVSVFKDRDFLFIQLPSRRRLAYYQPKIEMKVTPWGESKPTFTYMGKNQHKYGAPWERLKGHAGLVTENIVQAIARDILVHWLMRCIEKGIDVRGHVHDEVIALIKTMMGQQALDYIISLIKSGIPWAPDLMLDAAGFLTKNYRKD